MRCWDTAGLVAHARARPRLHNDHPITPVHTRRRVNNQKPPPLLASRARPCSYISTWGAALALIGFIIFFRTLGYIGIRMVKW